MSFSYPKLILPICTILTIASSSVVANEKGNGGGGWVCRDGSGRIKSAALWDLKEGRAHGKIIPVSDRPEEEQTRQALNKLREQLPNLAAAVERELPLIRPKFIPVGGGYRLPPPPDIHLYSIPDEVGCNLEGVIQYNDRANIVEFDPKIYESPLFSNTDRSASRFHEALYKVYRNLSLDPNTPDLHDSGRARDVVATLYSEQPLVIAPPGSDPGKALFYCTSGQGSTLNAFYIREEADGRTVFDFTHLY